MLKSFSSNAIITKSRAMFGKRLSKENYKELTSLKSVGAIATYLKEKPGYSDVLSNIYPETVHRGQLELLLRKSVFHKYIRLTRYDISNKNSFMSFAIHRLEIEQILRCIMYLNAEEERDFIADLPGYLISHATFPILQLAEAHSFDTLMKILQETPYYRILNPFSPKAEERVDYTACEIALKAFYFQQIFDTIDRTLKGKERTELKETVTIQIELLNIARIFRLKKFFKMEPEEIRKHLLPFYYRPAWLKKLIEAESEEDILKAIRNSSYGNKLDYDRFIYIEDYTKQLDAYYSKKLMRFSSNASAIAYCFMELLEIELSNITNIIEGIRYHMAPENIEKLLIIL